MGNEKLTQESMAVYFSPYFGWYQLVFKMLYISRFSTFLLLVQASLNAAKSINPRYGTNCKDFTLDHCPLSENTVIDSHVFPVSQCPLWCGIVNGCLVWYHDGRTCYLLETDNRDTCH